MGDQHEYPAGWYPDNQTGGQRYWDGTEWTEHRAPPPPTQQPVAARAATGGGVALWDGQTFVGLGVVGLIVAAVLYFGQIGPFKDVGEKCIITAVGGNKLCGDDARAWCDSTDQLRTLDPADTSSREACEEVRR